MNSNASPALRPGWRTEAAAMLGLAAPLALANLLQMLTYAIDVVFIARLGARELAASALAVAVFSLVMWSLQSLIGAVAPIIAAQIGANPQARGQVRRAMRMALWLAVGLGSVATVLCLFAEALMLATGQDPAIAALAADYLDILALCLVPMLLCGALRQYVATLGFPAIATAITAAGIGINAFGNWVFIFGKFGMPALGLEGAALATLATALASLALYVAAIRLNAQLRRYRIFGGLWRFDRGKAAEILRIGTPIGLTVLAEAGVFGAAAFLMGRIGALELAAHTIALQIASFAFMVPYGVAQAATIRVGLFQGARDGAGVARAGWTAIALGTGFMGLTAAAMLSVPELLLSPYVDPDAPANLPLVTIATGFLAVAAAFQLFDGLQVVAAGALRGLKDTRAPMWIAVFSYWVPGFGLAAGLGLGTALAGTGVWIGLAGGLVVAALLLMRRWHRREALGLVLRAKNCPPGG